MIVKCEKCQVSFNVKDSLVKKEGSRFRCSKCNHVFMIYPPEPVKTDEPVKSSEPLKSVEPDSHAKSAKHLELVPKKDDKLIDEDTPATDDISGGFSMFDESAERYEEIKTIGEGGMGEVLLAQDTQLRRKVAIKALKEESPEAAEFFVREAIITAQLDHPNIVPLYTIKQPEGERKNVSFVMKLVKGTNLHEMINKIRKVYHKNSKTEIKPELKLRSRLEYFLKACEGISYAHNKRVIHRDLKPANIMIGGFGEVYVMD